MPSTQRRRTACGLAWFGCGLLTSLCLPANAWAASTVRAREAKAPPSTHPARTSALAAKASKSPRRPPPAPAELDRAQLARARKLWYRGVEAFRKGRFAEARIAFQDCYQISPRTDVLRNLSLSELRSGHPVEAARHLKQLLETPQALQGAARADAEKLLSEAKAQVGELQFDVDIDGAELSVDGEAVGRSPLASYFVKPGKRKIRAFKRGYSVEEREVLAKRGLPLTVSVRLESLQRAAPLGLEAARAAAPAAPHGDEARRGGGMGGGETAVLASLGALALGGAGAGVWLARRADSQEDDAGEQATRLPANACSPQSPFVTECASLRRQLGAADDSRRWSQIAYVGAGVSGVLALGYGLWLALRSPAASAETAALEEPPAGDTGRWHALRMEVSPTLGGRGAGWASPPELELSCYGGCISISGKF